MKELPYPQPGKHLFVCVNTKEKEPYCGTKISMEDYKSLKLWMREKHPDIKLTKVLCLGHCSEGANIMIYPEGKIIGRINNLEEIKEYVEELW